MNGWTFDWNNDTWDCYDLGSADPWLGQQYFLYNNTTFSESRAGITIEKIEGGSTNNSNTVDTWSGKKLILITDSENANKKYYDFSTEITSGLTCGTGYIPEIDEVYNADATIKATNLFVHVVEYSNDNVEAITELSNTLPIDDTNISNEPINNISDEINNLTENFETILG